MLHQTRHDWKAVDHFTKLSIEHLKQKGVKIKTIHEFTDQAPNQFKSGPNFNHLSECHIPVCHPYLGSRHRKLSANGGSGIFSSGIQGKWLLKTSQSKMPST